MPSLPNPTMQCCSVPGLVSECICPITQGFKAANHAAMPHRKASLLSCALCLNKHLNKHLGNHFSPHLNTHKYTLTHNYYTHLAYSATHRVDLVSGQCPEPWSCCPAWLENRENYDLNIPTGFISRQRGAVRKWCMALSNSLTINLSLFLSTPFFLHLSLSVLLGSDLLVWLLLFMALLFIVGIYEFAFGHTLQSTLVIPFIKTLA